MSTVYGDDATRHFTEFTDRFLKSLFEFMPPVASSLGLHEYDGRTPDLGAEPIEERIEALYDALDEIDAIDPSGFDPETRLDYDLLRQGISAERFRLAELRELTYSPMLALWYTDVTSYIKRDYAPAEERIEKMIAYERGIPKLIDQAIELFEPPLARPILQVAIDMASGQAAYMRNRLPDVIGQQVTDGMLKARFGEANDLAVEAIEGYIGYMKEQLGHAKEDFAIGEAMFERMLAVNELVDLPLERVLEAGKANLEANKQALIETARLIDPSKDVREIADMVANDHPTAEGLIPETAAMLEEIRQYLIDNDIISVPSEIRCKVEETPEFMRWGFAFMDSPGPFDEKASEAYYYVTPVEDDWTEQEKEEWLRRFNYSTLRDVSIHEAYPGHYVHFLHAAKVMSPVRKVFGSYSFIEGWAHYCEQMMVEEGYRGESHLLHFGQLSEALLRNCRYVVSILMHTGRMTLDEATQFFMENGFMEELPARKEAMRGTFDPGYLNYTLGKLMLLKLRDDLKAKEGASFKLKSFHDQVLALGYPPVPLVRKHLLGQDHGAIL
jgi:uncharacterized protein (DUF885 family)